MIFSSDPAFSAFASAGIISFLLGFVVHPLLLKFKIVDTPNARSSHDKPTTRGGGSGFLAVILLLGASVAASAEERSLLVLLIAAGILGCVSFVDDIRTLPAKLRFIIHGVLAGVGILAIGTPAWELRVASFTIPMPAVQMLAWIWIAGYTNAFNFMDGINGLAGGQAVVTGLGMAAIAAKLSGCWTAPEIVLCLVIAGAAAGFLPHNFPRARMFMGDVGSASLGFLLSSLCVALVKQFGPESIIPLVFLHLNFVLDTGITLVRRIARGDTWYSPHREHFYQRLIRSGKSHKAVTFAEMALALVCCALILASQEFSGLGGWLLLACCPIVWGAFFVMAEREFLRSQTT